MMLAQVATETMKSSSAIFLDGVAIMALIGAGGLVIREYFKTRHAKQNGNGNNRWSKPGMASECLKHRDEINRLDIGYENVKEDIVEMKGDIKELLRRVPPKD